MLFAGCDTDDMPIRSQRSYTLHDEPHAVIVADGVDVIVDSTLPSDQIHAKTNAHDFGNLNIRVSNGVLSIDTRGVIFGLKRYIVYIPSFAYNRVEVSGGSDFLWTSCDGNALAVEASGGSDCTIKGVTRTLRIEASGGSDVDCEELIAEDVTVDASGGSNVEVYATGTLALEASGGSDIHITGNPEIVDWEVSGGSDVEFN